MADFFHKHKCVYPRLAAVRMKPLNFSGIQGYAVDSATMFSSGMAPNNGFIAATAGCLVSDLLLNEQKRWSAHWIISFGGSSWNLPIRIFWDATMERKIMLDIFKRRMQEKRRTFDLYRFAQRP